MVCIAQLVVRYELHDVVLDVAGMAWFERLLLQLGPEAYVVRPPDLADLACRLGLPTSPRRDQLDD